MSFLCLWNKIQKLKLKHALGWTVVNLEWGQGGKLRQREPLQGQNHQLDEVTTNGKDTGHLHIMVS